MGKRRAGRTACENMEPATRIEDNKTEKARATEDSLATEDKCEDGVNFAQARANNDDDDDDQNPK